MRYQVIYNAEDGVRSYCLCDMSYEVAKAYLADFCERYFNKDGSPKAYPNGRGYYSFSNPRIVPVVFDF